MVITLDTRDARTAKAILIAADAGQWLKCRGTNGEKAYGIRSSRDPNHIYFVTASSCSCYDARDHVCKHQTAVRIFVGLRQAVQPVRRLAVTTRED